MAALHWADYVIFVLVLLVSLGIGVYHALTGGRQRTTAEFIMADRKLRVLPAMFSMLMSHRSAIMIMGMTAEIYSYGTQQWFIGTVASMPVGLFICERLIVPWIYPLQLTSVYTFFELRFKSRAVRCLGAFFGLLSALVYIGVAMFAPSTALEATTGLSMEVSIPIMAALAASYSAIGGMRAVIWTDVFQGAVMLTGMLVILVKGTYLVGGLSATMDEVTDTGRMLWADWNPDPRVRHTFWTLTIGYAVSMLNINGVQQASVQRYSATPSLTNARLVLLTHVPASVFMSTIAALTGCVILAYYHQQQCDPISSGEISHSNQLVPLFVKTIFADNKGFSGLFLATLYSGALSSVSSSMSACAAIAWEDILKQRYGHLSEHRATVLNKILVFLSGVIGTCIAFLAAAAPGPIVQVSNTFMGAAGGPAVGMLLFGGIFRTAEWRGALCGGLAGFVVNVWLGLGSSTVHSTQSKLPPLSTEGCLVNSSLATDLPVTTFTPTTPPTNTELSGVQHFYALSYLYIICVGAIVVIVIGLLVSSFSRRFFPEKEEDIPEEVFINWRTIFTFGELPDRRRKTVKYALTSVDDKEECTLENMNDLEKEPLPDHDGSEIYTNSDSVGLYHATKSEVREKGLVKTASV